MELDYKTIQDPNSPFNRLLLVHKNLLFFWNVHVSNDNHRFFAMLSTIARVQWCEVLTVGNGEFGHAYAKFYDPESVKKVQEKLDTLTIHNEGYPMCSQLSNIAPCTRLLEAGRVIIDGLDASWTEGRLRNMYSPYGLVLDVQKFSTNCAVVFYGTEREALRAVDETRGREFNGKAIRVFHYNISNTPNPMTNKRICFRPYNLPLEMTSEQLKQMFSILGNVSARVFRNSDGTSKGHGYVFLDTPLNDTPILRSFCYYHFSDAVLSLNWLGSTYKDRRPFREGKYTKFPPSALPDDKNHNLFELPKVAKPFVDEIEDYEHLEYPSLLECCLGAYHLHITNYEGRYNRRQLIELFQKWGKVIYCTTQKAFAIISYNTFGEAQAAVEKAKKLDKQLTVVLLDSYQFHHLNSLAGDNISANLLNPIVGTWVYKFSDNGEIKKLPTDELMRAMDARNRETSTRINTSVDDSDKTGDNKAEIAAYARHMHRRDNMIGPAFSPYNAHNPNGRLVSQMPSQEHNAIGERVNRLFPKSTWKQKSEMVEVMTMLSQAEKQEVLTDDDKFRQMAIKKIVEMKRLVR